MRFKVPQNIDIEDRIIGPLTMTQFVYAVIGGFICYAIFQNVAAPLSYLIIAPVALFVLCLDFVKINERPFLNFFLAAIQYTSNPKQMMWHQGDGTDLQIEIYQAQKQSGSHLGSKVVTREDIEQFAKKKDTGATLIKN